MGARASFLAFSVAISGLGFWGSTAFAQEGGQDPLKVENSKYQFEAVITGNSVQVRSGPGENYYPTMKLDKGARVRVVGIKFDWLKIVPPEGSYSVVAKQYLTLDADKTSGTITGDSVNIRAGSLLNNVKVAVQCQLSRGTKVHVIKDDGEYYYITPPAEAYLFVNQKYAEAVKQLATQNTPEKQLREVPSDFGHGGTSPTTRPALDPRPEVVVQPKGPSQEDKVLAEFERLEALSNTTWNKPLEEMPVEELTRGYEVVVKSDLLPQHMRTIGEVRLAALGVKARAKQDLLESKKHQAEADAKLAALRAEREAIELRLRSGQQVFTAVGKLQASTVKSADVTVYRLTDPATDRTLCYVRSNDTKFTEMVGKFIGVKGELKVEDGQPLKTIDPTEMAEVEPEQVSKTISAQIVPPSLVKKAGNEAVSAGN